MHVPPPPHVVTQFLVQVRSVHDELAEHCRLQPPASQWSTVQLPPEAEQFTAQLPPAQWTFAVPLGLFTVTMQPPPGQSRFTVAELSTVTLQPPALHDIVSCALPAALAEQPP